MRGIMRPGMLAAAAFTIVLVGAAVFFVRDSLKQPQTWAPPQGLIPVISTRGSFDREGRLIAGHVPTSYRIEGELPGWESGSGTRVEAVDGPVPGRAPADLLIVIHGFNNSAEKALFKFDVAREGLQAAGYSGLIAGWSWDADRQKDPLAMTGYHAGRRAAVGNAAMLAQFIRDYRARCPDCRIHLLGYSMGARLAAEALLQLAAESANTAAQSGGPLIHSVHLVGAAVDNDEAELGAKYGAAIQSACRHFYNYYSDEDDKLGAYYFPKEADRALGETGIEHPELAPPNYSDIDVSSELHSYDDHGIRQRNDDGDNHSGYLGNRAPDGRLLDDGVMDLVAARLR